ncbi:Bacterial mobilisation domain-containing protein, partial [Dysosmobacter welbionis]
SVRLSVGVENSVSVLPNSTRSPSRKNAVLSETRAACCILWVTMMTVYLLFSSTARSSILEVEMGSRALVDSSISRISGSTAKARAMHSRCCWPPERPRALFFSRSFTSSQMAAERR